MLLILASTAGCLTPANGSGATASSTASGGPTTTATTGSAAVNHAPTPVVDVSLNGTALAPANGSYLVPAGANVTFDATNSTDPDGDNITFAWDFGDNQTGNGSLMVHRWVLPGNVTVNLTVADARGASAHAAFNLSIHSTGPAPGTPLPDENKKFTGTYTVAVQGVSCVASTQGVGASATVTWKVPASGAANVRVTKVKVVLTGGTTTIDQALRVVAPDGKNLGDKDEGSGNGETLEVSGSFPPGDYKITVYGCVAVNGSYAIDATASLVTA